MTREWSVANAMNRCWDWEISMVMLENVRKNFKVHMKIME